jgi:hypothetical protein
MTPLRMTPELVISSILLVISFVSFIFVYNKALKNRVDKTDLKDLRVEVDCDIKDLKAYVDKQDRGIHARMSESNDATNKKLDIIIERLIK